MKDKVRIGNHPIHPMLVPLPIGLWIFSLVADVIYLGTGHPAWAVASRYTMAGGIVGAVLAALPGFLDYLAMPASTTKKIATKHLLLNVLALVLFIINFYIRSGTITVGTFILSIIGVGLIVIAGWYGGHMVYVLGMAVDEDRVCATDESDRIHSVKR